MAISWTQISLAIKNGDTEKVAEYRSHILGRMKAKAIDEYLHRRSIQSVIAAAWGDVLLKLKVDKDDALAKFQMELLVEFAERHGLTAYMNVKQIQPGDTVVVTWKDKKKINTSSYRVMGRYGNEWAISLSMWEHDATQFEAHKRNEAITNKNFLVGLRQKTPPTMRKPQKFYLINLDKMELNFTGFETAIKNFLDNLANEDTAFAETYQKPNKSISECCKYICQEVEKNRKDAKCVACTDEEIYGLAIHYYDEDDIVVDGPKAKVETVAAPQSAETAKTEEVPTPAKTEVPKPKRTRKKTAPTDPDMPDALVIPLF